jgi:hypothetical protein
MVQYWENIDCAGLQNQQVTLSVRVRCSSPVTLHCGILQWSGIADQPSNDPWTGWPSAWGANWTLAGSDSVLLPVNTWTNLQVTMTLGTFSNCGPVFWTDTALAQNTTLEFEKIKVEIGSVVTPFEVRPVGAELALCQRYYQRLQRCAGLGWRDGTKTIRHTPVSYIPMRAIPTVSDSNPTWTTATTSTGNEVGFDNVGAGTITISGTLTINYTVGSYFILPNLTASSSFSGTGGDLGIAVWGQETVIYLDAEL